MTAEEIASRMKEAEQAVVLRVWGGGVSLREQRRAFEANPHWGRLGLVVREEDPELYTLTPLGIEVLVLVRTMQEIMKRLT